MPNNTIKHSDELIIRGDQVFSREYFESPLGNVEELLEEACIQKTHKILNLMFPSILRNPWSIGHYFAETPQGEHFVFTEIEYFPFPDSHAVKREEFYYLCPAPAASASPRDFETGECDAMGNCPKWYPPKNARFFLMTGNHRLEPFFFMIHLDYEEPIVPKIPNVFNTGRICTGDSYEFCVRVEQDIFNKTRAALDSIRTSPANGDLRENDMDFIKWEKNDEGAMNPVDIEWKSSFGRNATDERIIEFTKTIRP